MRILLLRSTNKQSEMFRKYFNKMVFYLCAKSIQNETCICRYPGVNTWLSNTTEIGSIRNHTEQEVFHPDRRRNDFHQWTAFEFYLSSH